MTAERFETLLADLLDGSLAPPERAELLAVVAADPARARRFVDLLCLEPLLVDCTLGEGNSEGFVRRVQQALQEEPAVERFTRGILDRLRQDDGRQDGRRRWRRPAALAAAVGLLILLSWFLAGPGRGPAPAPVARLEEVRGEVYVVAANGRTPAAAGQALLVGQGVQTAGEDSAVIVRLADATRLELGLHTSVHFDPVAVGSKVFLAEGLLTAEVPAPATETPMVVVTPHAEVTPQPAARFSLSNVPDSMHIELESGALAVRRSSDGQTLRRHTGPYAGVSSHAAEVVALPLAPRLSPPATVLGRHADQVASLAFTPDGRTLASGSFDGTVKLWDAIARRQRDGLTVRPRATSVRFTPDGQTLAVVVPPAAPTFERTVVELIDLATGRKQAALPAVAHVHELQTVTFSPDGRTLASVDEDRNIHLWDLASQQCQATFRLRKGRVLCLAFSPDGRSLTAVDEYGQATIWGLPDGRVQATVKLERCQGDKICAAFSPDRRWLVMGAAGETVQVWEAASGRLATTLHGHRGKVYCLVFSADGALLATGSKDGTTRLWDVATGQELATLEGSRTYVRSVAFAPDGQSLAVGGNDGTVVLWDLAIILRDLGDRRRLQS